MHNLLPILLDSNLSSTVTDYLTVFKSILSFIKEDWYLMALIGIPLVASIVGIILGVLRR